MNANTQDVVPFEGSNTEPGGNVVRRSMGRRKDIPVHVGVRKNKPSHGTLPRAEPDLSGGEGPAQPCESEQELEPAVDRDRGASHEINDEQANAENLPALIDTGNARLPVSYEQAKRALAACSIDECMDWEDRAAALAAYGRMAGDTELEKLALRIRAHAARRAGELLLAIPRETGGRPTSKKNSGERAPEFSDTSLEPAEKPMSLLAAAAKDAGMSEHQAKGAMRVAAVPTDDFERQVNGSTPPSVAILAKLGTRKRPRPTAPAADVHHAKADDHKNYSIGADAVARALEKLRANTPPTEQNQIAANTRERRACLNAFAQLPIEDAAWASKMAFYVEQEAGDIERVAGRIQERDDEHNLGGAS